MSDSENYSSDEDKDNVDVIVIRTDVQNHRVNEPCDVNEVSSIFSPIFLLCIISHCLNLGPNNARNIVLKSSEIIFNCIA